MNQKLYAMPISLKDVKITGQFWKKFQDLVRTQVIPYQWEALNDRVPGAEPSYCMRNFRIAAGKEEGEHGGWYFQDSDFAKWIEAVGYSLMWHPDLELEKIADGAIDEVVAAQQPDGYLDTYYIINGIEKRFTNLMANHELYCLGHLLEGAIAYYQATGKDKLLKALIKYVDLVDSLIGPEAGKIRGYDGHQEVELALVKLYHITKDEKHLKLAKYFIDERGRQPLFFDEERKKHGNSCYWDDSLIKYDYYQAAEPVRDQQYAVGHSVRALYMYAGMADVARETNDDSLMEACLRLWKDTTQRQMYVTGGVGSSRYGEAFTFDYDLPNDTVYSETCACISLAFFAQRMFNIEPKREYTDIAELCLFNGIISGMAADGKSFFYVNPLEVLPEATKKDQLKKHVLTERPKWFGCSCCPPNLARLISSFGAYAYSKSGDTFFLNLFAESSVQTELKSGKFGIDVKTSYPWDESVKIGVTEAAKDAVLAVRIPGWCKEYSIKTDGVDTACNLKDGYAYFNEVKPGSNIEIVLKMPVTIIGANPKVRENIGKVTVKRGPVVYCIEGADNGDDLHRVFLPACAKFEAEYDEAFLGGAVLIKSDGRKIKQDSWNSDDLYSEADAYEFEDISLKWIPYYLWANRGENEMTVWVKKG